MFQVLFRRMIGVLFFLCVATLGLAHAHQNIRLSPEEEAFLAQHPDITLGYSTDFPPFMVLKSNGEPEGVLPDFIKHLNVKLGTRIHLKTDSWQASVSAARRHEIDGLGLTTLTGSLRKDFDASNPVFSTFLYLFVRSDEHLIDSLADLEQRSVGYLEQMHSAEPLLLLQPIRSVKTYPDIDQLMAALASGEIDAVLGNASIEYWRKRHGKSAFKATGVLPESKSGLSFLLDKDQPILTHIINKGLAAITDSEKQAILTKWFGDSLSPWTRETSSFSLTEQERAWLAANPLILAGFDPLSAPIEYLGDDEQAQGMSIEYLKYLEPMLRVRFEFASGNSWAEVQQQVAKGTLDMLPAIAETMPRREMFNFTEPYLSVPTVIFSAVNRAYLGNIDALHDQKVIVIEDSSTQEWLEQDFPSLDFTTVQDTNEALRLLMRDENAVFIGNLITTSYYIGQSGLLQIRVVGETPHKSELRMAVRKDWPLLPGILNKALHAIPQHERDAIYNDWISIKYRHSIDYSTMMQIIGLALFVIALIAYWNLRMSREIRQRRHAETELLKAKQVAEQANQAKSEFLANISHELRTPMHAVLGFTTLLQQVTPVPGKQGQYLQGIQVAGSSLLQLIDDILDLTKAEAGRLELEPHRADLRTLIREIESTFSYRATDKNLTLSYQVLPDVPAILWLDAIRLRQILVNLIGNAIKFTDKGSIAVRVSSQRVGSEHVSLRIAVHDTGIGIPTGQQEVIFGLFNQGKGQDRARYKGTGLGLAISQRLATLMGGEVGLKSTPGVGSTFTVVLPSVHVEKETKMPESEVDIRQLEATTS